MLLLSTKHLSLLIIIFVLVSQSSCLAARSTPVFTPKQSHDEPNKWHDIDDHIFSFQRGSDTITLSELKKYFRRFGYLPLQDHYNVSDEAFKSAIVSYQTQLGLPVTGKLDFETVSLIMAPRCGVPDSDTSRDSTHAKKNYVFFPGKPRWTRDAPMELTYSFSKDNFIDYLKMSDIRAVFKRAFTKWASVIPVSFVETSDYGFADIRIGFYSGDHGDGEPFDGVLGVLAHSFTPESGRFHLDAAERWAVDFKSEKSAVAVDLESVAIHEIGHLLGLSHSSFKDAVMYPTLKPRDKKLDLSLDDVEGVQALYGSNPNFTLSSFLESDISANQAVDLRRIGSSMSALWASLILSMFSLLFFACDHLV